MPPIEIAITGVGMTTAVGRDIVTSSASCRAGIVRAQELDHFEYFDEKENELVSVVGHVAGPQMLASQGLGKMIGLGAAALDDLFETYHLDRTDKRLRTAFLITLPNYSFRQKDRFDVNKMLDNVTRSHVFKDEAADENEDRASALRFAFDCNQYLMQRMMAVVDLDINVSTTTYIYADQSGFITAMIRAMELLEMGEVDRCIVGGIDSFLEPDTLAWAISSGRLKTPDKAIGFSAGEGAAFVQFERFEGAVKRGARIDAVVSRQQVAIESSSRKDEGPPTGEALALVIRSILLRNSTTNIGLMVGDSSGEQVEALDWGCASVRLNAEFSFLRDIAVWYPSMSFGKTGCAFVGLAIGFGVHMMRRSNLTVENVLVWCSSETNSRGALLLKKSAAR